MPFITWKSKGANLTPEDEAYNWSQVVHTRDGGRMIGDLDFADQAAAVFGDGLDATLKWDGTNLSLALLSGKFQVGGGLQLWDGAAWRDAVHAGQYTAADVLAKLLTVDGAASGLDADKLDGAEGAAYALLSGATFAALGVSAASGPKITLANTGNGTDLKRYQLLVQNTTGNLYLQAVSDDGATAEVVALFERNGAVTLYHDNTATARTQSGKWQVYAGSAWRDAVHSGQFLDGYTDWDIPSLAAGARSSARQVTVSGAAVGDFVVGVSHNKDDTATGVMYLAKVTAANTVDVYAYNAGTTTQDMQTGYVYVRVMKKT